MIAVHKRSYTYFIETYEYFSGIINQLRGMMATVPEVIRSCSTLMMNGIR